MAITYDKAGDEAQAIIAKLIDKFHAGLKDGKANIECLTAQRVGADGEVVGGSAVKIHGHSAAAKVKINSLADRTEGKSDATITLDHEQWEGASGAERQAIIDHCLQCLDVMREDGKGEILTDDQGRPRMKLRKHDHFHQWFDAVADRHKTASIEVKQAKAWFDKNGQGWFSYLPFDNGPTPRAPSAEKALEKAVAAPDITKINAGNAKHKGNGKANGNADRVAFGQLLESAIVSQLGRELWSDGAMDSLACFLAGKKNLGFAKTKKFLKGAKPEQFKDWIAKLDEMTTEQMRNVVTSGAPA